MLSPFVDTYKYVLLSASVHQALEPTHILPTLNLITMRFSLFAVLSGLAALAVVSALPAELNLKRDFPFEDVDGPTVDCCSVSLILILRLIADTYSSM